MDVAMQNLIPISDKAGGAESVLAADESTVAPGQCFTLVLKNTQESEAGQNRVPISDGTGCAGVTSDTDATTAAPGECLTHMLKDSLKDDSAMSASSVPVQICTARFDPAEAPHAEDMPVDVPSDLLKQLAVLLKTVLGKAVAFGGVGEAAVGTKTPDVQLNRTADDDTSSSGDGAAPSEEQSLIQRLAAAVLTMVQPELRSSPGTPAEAETPASPAPQASTEQLVTALRAIIARERTPPLPQATDNAQTIPTQDDDLVQQLAAKLLEHLSTAQQDGENHELPRSDKLPEAGIEQHVITSSKAQPEARGANLNAPTLPDELVQENNDPVKVLGVHGAGDESVSVSSGRNEAMEHRREEKEHPQAEHPAPNQRVAETTSRFDLKTAEAPVSTSDRQRGDTIRPLPPQQEWAELEAKSPLPSVHLEVAPEDVGRVRLHVALAGDRVYANVTTEHAGVRDFLLGERQRLEEDLSAQGLEMKNFQVAVERNGHRGTEHRGQTPWIQTENRADGPPSGEAEARSEEVPLPLHHEVGRTTRVLSLFA